MTCHTKEELENMLMAVIDELNLSEKMIEKHGPLGTPVHEIVREVLDRKNLEIQALKSGFKVIYEDQPTTNGVMNMSELNERLEWLADYILNNNLNYCGGEFERYDTNEKFLVVVQKESALRDMTSTITEQEKVISELKAALERAEDTAIFYRDCSGNKSTLKFGYSRVIEELTKHKE